MSAVLNRAKGVRVGKETRRKILDVARKLGYRRQHYAHALRKGKSFFLGFAVRGTEYVRQPYFASVLAGISEEVAKTAVFLASDDASYLTGQAINISGGSVMH